MNGTLGGSTGGTIADSSPNGFVATYTGGGGASYVSGPFAQGINSNGGRFVIPASPAFDSLQAWTDFRVAQPERRESRRHVVCHRPQQ